MTGQPGRIILLFVLLITGWGFGQASLVGPSSAMAAPAESGDKDHSRQCKEINPDWFGLSVAVNEGVDPIEVGRVFSASDGMLAVLTVVTDVDDDGDTQGVDFSASLSISVVIIQGSDHTTTIVFDPPARGGAGLAADDLSAIESVTYCYRARLPIPPATETATATEAASPVASVEPTQAPDVGATETASASQTEAAVAQATVQAEQTEAAATPEATLTTEPSTTPTEAPTETVEPTATSAPTETAVPTETATTPATVAPSETAVTTETTVPSETTVPTELATVAPTPVVLYSVPETEGFDTWTVPGGWSVANGLLTADGSDFQGYAQPTRSIDQANYAVEVEMRVVEQPATCGGNLGLVMRGSETGFYGGGIEWVCDAGSTVRLWAYDQVLAEQPIVVDQDWFTLRIEANGDVIRLSVDGVVIAEVTNATFPTGGQIALWSNRIKVEVRAVRVTAVA